jgi:RNA polymerase primary sigma factor
MENYYKEIKRIRLLSQEEEIILSREIKKGDKASLEILIKHNLRLVLKISQSYQNVGLDFEDVVAEGNIGLIEAATRYDGDKGNRFSTYASWWIKQAILYAISQKGRQIRLPMNVINDMIEADKAPSLAQILKGLGLEPGKDTYTIPIMDVLKYGGWLDSHFASCYAALFQDVVSVLGG